MNGAPLYPTLAACLDDDPAPATRALASFNRWEQLARVGTDSLVAPALYPALRRKNLLAVLPSDFADYLKTLNQLNARRNASLRATLEHCALRLNRAGIVPGLLKGAAGLAQELYADPGERVLGDLDLLVPAASIADAERCLKADGYQTIATPRDEPLVHQIEALAHPLHPGAIELHRSIVKPGRGLAVLERVSAALAQPWHECSVGAARCLLPVAGLQVAHRFVHDMLHDPGYMRGWISMRGLYEAYRLERRSTLPWPALEPALQSPATRREWAAYRQALEWHFPSLPRRARHSVGAMLWNLRLRAQQRWPWLYRAHRRLFQAARGWLSPAWLRDRGW